MTGFASPIGDRYFEDYVPGSVHEYGPIPVEEREIIEFSRKFDPQYFHVDPVAAARSPFGGLIASGWHTVALAMRLLVDNYLSSIASLASPGVDELRWTHPVRPGDILTIRVVVEQATLSGSTQGRGTVVSSIEAFNQDRVKVASMKAVNLFRTRGSPSPA